MEDFREQLSALLENPEGMKMLSDLAGSFMNSEKEPAQSAPTPELNLPDIPLEKLEMFMKIGGALSSDCDDDRSRLLLALKPHLSPERQAKVDKTIKLLKLIEILPLLRESGFNFF